MEWARESHSEAPDDAALFGTDEPGVVTWWVPDATAPPANVDVPVIAQIGSALHCTKGNWDNTPTSYAYQWQLDGVDAGTDSPDSTVTAGDVGKTATCIVTATNSQGSVAAPPSNEVVIA